MTSGSRSPLSNNPRIAEHVGLVAAPRRELRHDRSLVSRAEPMQGVRRDRELVAGPELDLTVPVDPEHDAPRAASERLLLARVPADRRMPVLRARLAGEEDELLRAHAVGVDVDDELEADLVEAAEAEVRDLDLLPLGRCQ